MQFSPVSYQLFVRTKNMTSDKHRSLLLFTGIPNAPGRRGEAAFHSFPTAATGAGQPGRNRGLGISAMNPKRTGQPLFSGLAKDLLWFLCTDALLPRVVLHDFLFCHSSLVIPFKKKWRKEIGQNVDSHHCNRHNTCYCDSDPIKITLTLMFLCTLVEEKAQLAPFPLSHAVFASLKRFAPAD